MIENRILGAMAVAFLVSTVFLVALRPVAIALHLVDQPGGRKLHSGDVPIVGGVAMFAGMFAGLLMLKFSPHFLLPIFVACSLILVIGVVDDRFRLPASARLSAQIAATLIMVYGANAFLDSIGAPFGTGEIAMGRFWLIFTMLVTLSMINAYNLVDGVDGLAGSLALIALLSIAAAAGIQHAAAVAALIVSAAIVGFLIFNFPTPWNRKERTFMGDAGSTLLGFTIVWIALGVSQGEGRVISPVSCLWFASLPIYDLFTCFTRRMLKRKSPFTPGRDHFHHKLMRGGFGVRQTLGILTGLQALYATAGLVAHFMGVPDVYMFTAWSILGISQHSVIMGIARYHRAHLLRKRLRPAL